MATDNVFPVEDAILHKIFYVREQKVMLDKDLALLYGVRTKVLNQAVQRHASRFPSDFMFQLSDQELTNLRSQIVTSSRGGLRYKPHAFTEQGISMLSSVLNSDQAITLNIQIMRVFTKVRQMLFDNTELRLAIEEIRKKTENNTQNIELVFKYLDELLDKKAKQEPPNKIGYKP